MLTPCFIFGTRPEIVKLSPLVAQYAGMELLIHTGQHYDELLDSQIRSDVEMRPPDVQMGIGGYSRHDQASMGLREIVTHLETIRPSCLIVQGDTNSSLIGALAGEILEIPVVHVESGLRSFDRKMPEERNRVLIDHCSELLLPPTDFAFNNLQNEGLGSRTCRPLGNTGIDSLVSSIRKVKETDCARDEGEFVLCTFHRPENVDDSERLLRIIDALGVLDREVVIPLHPRLSQRLAATGVRIAENITLIDPLSYLDMISKLMQATLVISDSGGLIEECSYLKVPLVSVRRSTERQEAFPVFARLIEAEFLREFTQSLSSSELTSWRSQMDELPCPYGEGNTSALIAEELNDLLGS